MADIKTWPIICKFALRRDGISTYIGPKPFYIGRNPRED